MSQKSPKNLGPQQIQSRIQIEKVYHLVSHCEGFRRQETGHYSNTGDSNYIRMPCMIFCTAKRCKMEENLDCKRCHIIHVCVTLNCVTY